MSLLRKIQAKRVTQEAQNGSVSLDAPAFTPARVARLTAESINREERFEKAFGKHAVRNSADLERILALPRRPVPDEKQLKQMCVEMTARLSNGRKAGDGCRCHELDPARHDGAPGSACITELREIQAWYLFEAAEVQGALGPIAVGAGKTGIDVLTAMVVPGCRQAVLLIPPGLKAQFLVDYQRWAQHFKVPNLAGGPGAGLKGEFVPGRPVLHVLKYSELSSPSFSTWFAARPEISVVIADEADALKDRNSVRTRRFLTDAAERFEKRYFFHTGSVVSTGIQDYSHLSALSLREGSPVPIDPHVVTAWGEAINPQRPGISPAPPGALLKLCAPGETVFQGFNRRFLETRGVVATFEGSLTGVELKFRVREPPPMPAEVKEALQRIRIKMERPDGEQAQEAMEAKAWACQVACGFYLYWNFPGAKPEDFAEPHGRIPVWRARRAAWNREVRQKLERHIPEMDSPGLLKKAAQRAAEGYRGEKPVWHSETWEAWSAVEKTVPHETRTKWINDWLARDAAAWALEMEHEGRSGIVWTENPSFGEKIAKLAVRPYYGDGREAELAIGRETGARSIVASIRAHYRGRNLQMFSANLLTQPPGSANICEQLLGRTHRSLQKRSEVLVDIYQHVSELQQAFEITLARAENFKATLKADQKLLGARDLGKSKRGSCVQ